MKGFLLFDFDIFLPLRKIKAVAPLIREMSENLNQFKNLLLNLIYCGGNVLFKFEGIEFKGSWNSWVIF